MKSERWVKEQISTLLRKHNVYYFMPAMGTYGRAGVLDYACCVNGKYLAIEAKSEIGTTTALQDLEIERIVKAGGVTAVVTPHNLEALERLLVSMKQ